MEISKMLTVSTAHITQETSELLDNDKLSIVVYPKSEYGWFILVCDWDEYENELPKDLKKFLMLAEDQGCNWLCLDCDGEVLGFLDVYEW